MSNTRQYTNGKDHFCDWIPCIVRSQTWPTERWRRGDTYHLTFYWFYTWIKGYKQREVDNVVEHMMMEMVCQDLSGRTTRHAHIKRFGNGNAAESIFHKFLISEPFTDLSPSLYSFKLSNWSEKTWPFSLKTILSTTLFKGVTRLPWALCGEWVQGFHLMWGAMTSQGSEKWLLSLRLLFQVAYISQMLW